MNEVVTGVVWEDQVTGHLHVLPCFDEYQHHVLSMPCPCNSIYDISAEVNGGQRIVRHNHYTGVLNESH